MTAAHKDTNGSELIAPDDLGGCRALAIWTPLSLLAIVLMGLGYWLAVTCA